MLGRLFATCCLAIACGGALHTTTSADSLAKEVEAALPSLRRDTATVFGLSTEGAFIEADYQGMTLRRLHSEFFGESGRAVENYYFDSGLRLVLRTEFKYDRPFSGRVTDSVTVRFDLTVPAVSRRLVDSLTTSAQELLTSMTATGEGNRR
ncbi:MAG: hypothetical protein U0132_16965 [Gemmatimonadaceae bacterium]